MAAGHRVAVPFAGAALREEENAPESRAEVRGRGLSPFPRVSPPSRGVLGYPGAGWLPGALQRLGHAPLCCSQHEEKEKAFKEQLAHLASLLPTLQVGPWAGQGCPGPGSRAGAGLPRPQGAPAVTPPCVQVHLVTCSAFLSSANKAEFLDLGYVSGASAAGRLEHPAAVPWGGQCTLPMCREAAGASCRGAGLTGRVPGTPHRASPLPFSN